MSERQQSMEVRVGEGREGLLERLQALATGRASLLDLMRGIENPADGKGQ